MAGKSQGKGKTGKKAEGKRADKAKAPAAAKSQAREAIWPGLEAGVPKPLMPYSPAIKAGGWVFIAGQIASDFATGLAPEVIKTNPFLHDELEVQSNYVLKNLSNTVKACGVDMKTDAVRIWQWFVSDRPTPEEFAAGSTWTDLSITPYLRTRDRYINAPRPASTGAGIRELLCAGTKIEVDLICFDDDEKTVGIAMPPDVPAPLAGYSPAVRRGDWVFVSGDIPVDWVGDWLSPVHMGEPSALAKAARENPYLWYGAPIEKQTDYVLQKLKKVVEAAGSSLDRCVKAEVYIGHPSDFAGMDRVWQEWFPKNPPARLVLPYIGLGGMGSRVEIALTLLANDSKLKIETIEAADAPRPIGHEPQAVKVGNLLFFSTQMANDSSGKLANGMVRHPSFPWYGSPGQAQMRYMMKNINAICEKAGTRVDQICRRACFHDDFQWFAESIEEWARYFPGDKPASTTIRLGGPLVVPGANTLLDLIAYVPD